MRPPSRIQSETGLPIGEKGGKSPKLVANQRPNQNAKQPEKAMKNLKSVFTMWIGLLALCLLPLAAPARGNPLASGIIGQIDSSGLQWTVEVFSSTGEEIATLQPNGKGAFEIVLPPGTYVLTPIGCPYPPKPGHPIPMFVLVGPAQTVTVVKNQFTHVVLPGAP
jgi:hypothetical protein